MHNAAPTRLLLKCSDAGLLSQVRDVLLESGVKTGTISRSQSTQDPRFNVGDLAALTHHVIAIANGVAPILKLIDWLLPKLREWKQGTAPAIEIHYNGEVILINKDVDKNQLLEVIQGLAARRRSTGRSEP